MNHVPIQRLPAAFIGVVPGGVSFGKRASCYRALEHAPGAKGNFVGPVPSSKGLRGNKPISGDFCVIDLSISLPASSSC